MTARTLSESPARRQARGALGWSGYRGNYRTNYGADYVWSCGVGDVAAGRPPAGIPVFLGGSACRNTEEKVNDVRMLTIT